MESVSTKTGIIRLTRCRNIRKSTRSNTLDAIAQLSSVAGGDSVVISQDDDQGGKVIRLKIFVKKQDLKQVVNQLEKSKKVDDYRRNSFTSSSLEHRLNIMRKRHSLRAEASHRRSLCSWKPALQSIAE